MNRIELFQSLPYPLKVVAASLHGWRLRRQRYGKETDARVTTALERESWSASRWRDFQADELESLLDRAARAVPHYRRHWQQAPGDPSRLGDWPLLEKAPLRERPEDFLAQDADPRRLIAEHTSGSTGTPLRLSWDRRTARDWYALVEARSRRWYGVDRHCRWAILGGRLVAEQGRRRPPFWVWNGAMGQLYCSAYHLAPDLVPAYLEAFERHGVRHLYGYGSALEALARSLDEAGLGDRARALGLAVAVSNAEPLFDHQRQLIGRVLGCPVRETYGMAELVAAGSECEHGRLHLWPEVGVVELLDPASGRCSDPWELGEGESLEGELVCTGLLNRVQPLVRYRVGDRARLRGGGCPCGRGLPILEKVEGRVDDGIRTPDGRSIGRLDPVFKDGLPIREAQIIQEQPDSVRLLVVPTPEFGTEDGEDLKRRLAQRIGAMEIHLETVSSIPRSAAGKRPLVINRLGTGEVAP